MATDYFKLSAFELREMLEYDPETGSMHWKVRPQTHFKNFGACKSWNTRNAGKPTGCLMPSGYLAINIRGTPYMAHRLAWAIYYGEFAGTIDHINRVRHDNRLCNLRACTLSQNQHNRTISPNNSSGFKGVSWHKQKNRWRAYIVVNWKQKSLGLYDTAEEAHAAYCKAADALHGPFANHGVPMTPTENPNPGPHQKGAPTRDASYQGGLF